MTTSPERSSLPSRPESSTPLTKDLPSQVVLLHADGFRALEDVYTSLEDKERQSQSEKIRSEILDILADTTISDSAKQAEIQDLIKSLIVQANTAQDKANTAQDKAKEVSVQANTETLRDRASEFLKMTKDLDEKLRAAGITPETKIPGYQTELKNTQESLQKQGKDPKYAE